MAGKMTDQGRKRLGQLVTKCRQESGFTNQESFAEWLTELSKQLHPDGSHIEVTESQIRTLEAASYQRTPNMDTIFAIIDAKVLKCEDGEPLDFADIAAILREERSIQVLNGR